MQLVSEKVVVVQHWVHRGKEVVEHFQGSVLVRRRVREECPALSIVDFALAEAALLKASMALSNLLAAVAIEAAWSSRSPSRSLVISSLMISRILFVVIFGMISSAHNYCTNQTIIYL